MADRERLVRPRTALVSVFDRAGLVEFVSGLQNFGVSIIATDGTRSALLERGVKAKSLQDEMKLPTLLSGRIKTLHAPLYAAILAENSGEQMRELSVMGVRPIDAVVCNFYPLMGAATNQKTSDGKLVESIDIGGPTMVRAASKNFERVLAVPSPKFYLEVLEEMKKTGGGTTLGFRKRLAVEAFRMTSAYDRVISNGLASQNRGFPARFPRSASETEGA